VRDPHEDGRGRFSAHRDGSPVLITEAGPSYAEQFASRKRKYAIIMLARIPCLALAGVFYQTWWLALGFVVLSVPLPWIAVLIANDRPPRKPEQFTRFRRRSRELESREHTVIES